MIFRSPYPYVEVPAVALTDFVLERSDAYGDKPALIDGRSGRAYTHAETASAIRAITGAPDVLDRARFFFNDTATTEIYTLGEYGSDARPVDGAPDPDDLVAL